MNIILMGPPGVGKGTQSQRLADEFAIPIVATGDMFRQIRSENTPLAQKVRDYMDRGEYVPDDLTIEMALRRLNAPDTRLGFILDGFPRTVVQADALDEALANEGRHIDHIILLTAPEDVVLQRLAGRAVCERCGRVYNESTNKPRVPGVCDRCGGVLVHRADESQEVHRHRMQVYAQQTEPVLNHFRSQGRLEEVDALAPVDEVTTQLRGLLLATPPSVVEQGADAAS